MAINIARLQSDVTNQNTVIAGLSTLITTLVQEIRDLQASTNDPATQSALDDMATQLEQNTTVISDAVTAGTTATPQPSVPGSNPTNNLSPTDLSSDSNSFGRSLSSASQKG